MGITGHSLALGGIGLPTDPRRCCCVYGGVQRRPLRAKQKQQDTIRQTVIYTLHQRHANRLSNSNTSCSFILHPQPEPEGSAKKACQSQMPVSCARFPARGWGCKSAAVFGRTWKPLGICKELSKPSSPHSARIAGFRLFGSLPGGAGAKLWLLDGRKRS